MSEEEYMEECERKYIEKHTTHIKGYTEEYVNNLQQKVEQLEKEVNEYHKGLFKIKKQTFDGRLLLKDVVKLRKEKEQLEKIIKEAIEYVETIQKSENNINPYILHAPTLLNILNKGGEE